MIYEAREFALKDGTAVVFKSPEIEDAKMLLDNIIAVAASTSYLLSEPEDFDRYVKDIQKEEDFIRSFRENRNYLIGVYIDGKIVGNCALNFLSHQKDKHRATIGIAIQEEYRGKGIGSLLFDEMIRLAKQTDGIEQIELDLVSVNEPAKRLYEKKGFIKTGVIPHQLKIKDGTYLDGEMMVLFLNKE